MNFPKPSLTKPLLIALALLLAVRAALPYAVKWYVNRVLDENPSYGGTVGDVDLHLWRGAYSVKDVRIVKKGGKAPTPFFSGDRVEFAVAWKELLHKQVVARLHFFRPEVNFVDGDSPKEKQSGKEGEWSDTVDKLVPFRIARLDVENGAVHFRNFRASPPVDVWIRNLNASVSNLTNSVKLSENLFAKGEAWGEALGGGQLRAELTLNPYEKEPTFDLKAKLLGLSLPALNSFFRKYAYLDFEKGRGDLVLEAKASKGYLKGYVKPLLRNLEVMSRKGDMERDHDNPFRLAWESIAGTIADVLKNQPKDQLATQIPFEGPVKKTGTSVLSVIGGVLSNAFVRAFTPLYDHSSDWVRNSAR